MLRSLAALAAIVCLVPSIAFGHGSTQVWLVTDGDRIVTHLKDSHGVSADPVRVFSVDPFVDIGIPGSPVFNAFVPGYGTAPDGDLPGKTLGFNVLGPLLAWDGDAFNPTTTEYLNIYPSNIAFTGDIDTGAGFVAGFNFFTVASSGSPHSHLEYDLYVVGDPSATPPDGLYALLLELTESSALYDDSAPFYLLFNKGVDHHSPEIAEARAFLNATLAPTPSALLGGVAGLIALVARRPNRRRTT